MSVRIGVFLGNDDLLGLFPSSLGLGSLEVDCGDLPALYVAVSNKVEYLSRLFDSDTERRSHKATFTETWDRGAKKMNSRKRRNGRYRIKRMYANRIKELLVFAAEQIRSEKAPEILNGRIRWSFSLKPQMQGDKSCRVIVYIPRTTDPVGDSKPSFCGLAFRRAA